MSIIVTINGEVKTSAILAETAITINKTYGEPWTLDLASFSLAGEVQDIEGDGSTQEWTLDRIPANTPTILVDGIPADVGILGVDTGKEFYWELGTANISQELTDPAPGIGVTLSVDLGTWYPSSGQTITIDQTHNVSYEVTGDGVADEWTLPQTAQEILSLVANNSLPQTFGILGVDTGKQYYLDLDTNKLVADPLTGPLPNGDTLDIGYSYLVRQFGGVIRTVERIKDRSSSDLLKCSITATDYNHILQRRLSGAWELTGTTDNAILARLMTDVLTAEGITTETSTAVDIESFKTDNDTAGSTLTEVGRIAGKRQWVGPDKVLRLLAPADSVAPFDIPSGASNISTLRVTETDEDYANVIVLKSSQTIADAQPEEFTGDGATTSFELARPVASAPTITVNGTTNTVGIWGVDTGRDWYWTQGSTQIRQDPDGVALSALDTLTVTYQGIQTSYVTAENTVEIARRAAIEGSTGRYEKLFSVDTLLSQSDAQTMAQAILDSRDEIPLKAVYTTSDYLEPEAKNLQPGQYQAILLEGWASQQNDYMVRSIQMSAMGLPSDRDYQFFYTVEAIYGSLTKTLFEWFRDLFGGGGGAAAGGSAAGAESEKFHFFLGGCEAVEVGTDIAAHRPVAHEAGRVYEISSDCKTAPSGEALVFDVLVSNDGGDTWESLFVAGSATHTAGETGAIFLTDFADVAITRGAKFRVDVTSSGSAQGWALKISARRNVSAPGQLSGDNSGDSQTSNTTTVA